MQSAAGQLRAGGVCGFCCVDFDIRITALWEERGVTGQGREKDFQKYLNICFVSNVVWKISHSLVHILFKNVPLLKNETHIPKNLVNTVLNSKLYFNLTFF